MDFDFLSQVPIFEGKFVFFLIYRNLAKQNKFAKPVNTAVIAYPNRVNMPCFEKNFTATVAAILHRSDHTKQMAAFPFP